MTHQCRPRPTLSSGFTDWLPFPERMRSLRQPSDGVTREERIRISGCDAGTRAPPPEALIYRISLIFHRMLGSRQA